MQNFNQNEYDNDIAECGRKHNKILQMITMYEVNTPEIDSEADLYTIIYLGTIRSEKFEKIMYDTDRRQFSQLLEIFIKIEKNDSFNTIENTIISNKNLIYDLINDIQNLSTKYQSNAYKIYNQITDFSEDYVNALYKKKYLTDLVIQSYDDNIKNIFKNKKYENILPPSAQDIKDLEILHSSFYTECYTNKLKDKENIYKNMSPSINRKLKIFPILESELKTLIPENKDREENRDDYYNNVNKKFEDVLLKIQKMYSTYKAKTNFIDKKNTENFKELFYNIITLGLYTIIPWLYQNLMRCFEKPVINKSKISQHHINNAQNLEIQSQI